jgi:hypothetical protein
MSILEAVGNFSFTHATFTFVGKLPIYNLKNELKHETFMTHMYGLYSF